MVCWESVATKGLSSSTACFSGLIACACPTNQCVNRCEIEASLQPDSRQHRLTQDGIQHDFFPQHAPDEPIESEGHNRMECASDAR